MFEFRETQNLNPISLANKEQLFLDLLNIEESWTGQIDTLFVNTFIQEAVQLITNAIVLFEKGYFDASFYSIRQSLEISTTIVYFVDDKEVNRIEAINKWEKGGKFPMHNQMIKELENRNIVFADMLKKMKPYFDEIDLVKQQLNKYVHKQGFDKYYVRVNNPINQQKSTEKLLNDFNWFIKKAIGAIAVHRLAIDPYPVLLEDEQIYKRTPQLITLGYNRYFIEEYIGNNHIEAYKETEVYKSYYKEIIKNEEMIPSVVNLVKDNFVERIKIPEILKQIHLLNLNDRIAVNLFASSEKISKVYSIGGWHWYFCETKSNRKNNNWGSDCFTVFKDGGLMFNRSFDEVYLSYLTIYNEDFYMEHNFKFTEEEICFFEEFALKYNKEIEAVFNPLQGN